MSATAIAEGTDPRLGSTLNDRYRITRKIGEGGMGLVYEGQHLLIRRRVAIKMLHGHMSQNDEVVARFKREAIAATSIRHPHIIEVLDMGTAPDGASYMVLEFLDGQDWSKEIEKTGPQPLGHVVKLMREVCDGLQAAHDKGIVHRDLKPENVFLTKHGDRTDFVKIVDFGISKIMEEPEAAAEGKPSHSLTKTGAAMGTPYAMAPEQLKGLRDVDHRADLWALGVMFFHALTGAYPFDGETFPMLAVNVLTGDPPRLSTYRADLPDGIQEIIDGLLQKDRGRRIQSAREVRQRLEAFAGEGSKPVVVRTTVAGDATGAASGIQPTMLGQGALGGATPAPTPSGSLAVGTPSSLPAASIPAAAPPPVGAATGAMPGQVTPASVPLTSITPAGLLATATPATLPAQQTLSGTIPGLPSAAPNRGPLYAVGAVVAIAAAVGITLAVSGGSPPAPPVAAPTPPTTEPTPPAAPPDPPATPDPPPAATAPTAIAAGATVRVQISTDPEGAELFLDGNPIGNPFDADLPSNTEIHHLEARMTGRVTTTRDISLAFPQRIVLELPREGATGSRPGGRTSGGSSSSSGGAATTSSGGSAPVAVETAPPPPPPPHDDPPPAEDPPAETSSGGRGLRNPFGR